MSGVLTSSHSATVSGDQVVCKSHQVGRIFRDRDFQDVKVRSNSDTAFLAFMEIVFEIVRSNVLTAGPQTTVAAHSCR